MRIKANKVSLGLPVFNGERYLAKALDSILSQTYRNYELIISDNASTDNTASICKSYEAQDSRVHYHKNETNLGVTANFNRVFQLSSSEYFKWVACDDIYAPDFLEKCVKELDANPEVVMSYSKTGRINEYGERTGEYYLDLKVSSSKPYERFGALICMDNYAWVLMFGLFRSNVLKKTQLNGSYIGSDRNLLSEIGLLGRFLEIPEYLFFRREHFGSYTNKADLNYSQKLKWWTGSDRHKKSIFPYWKICLEYINSVEKMPLDWCERMRCYAQIIKWFVKHGWFLMSLDVAVNFMRISQLRGKFAPFINWFLNRTGLTSKR